LRDVTIEQQDDYDRSPLFIDVVDFAAGAGPHVITVPSDWSPTSPDMRFYRLDNSGIITPLTPSSTSSTTFTLAETLLSTDVIFIGDDEFRENRYAAETYAGIVEKATAAEMTAATADKYLDAATIQGYYGALQYEEVTAATLGGLFTSGSIHVTRIGRTVTIVGENLLHSSTASLISATNSLPAWAEPLVSATAASNITANDVRVVQVTTSRQFGAFYRDWIGSAFVVGGVGAFSISYISAS
jgi:hypothetical protein